VKIFGVILFAVLFFGPDINAHEAHEHAPGPGLFGYPAEYIHVLLNPLPTYGLALGILGLATALLIRSKGAKLFSFGIVLTCSVVAWPVVHYGQNAYSGIRAKADEASQQWLGEHMKRGERWAYIFYLTAVLAAAALATDRKFPRAATPLALATLVVAGISVGVGGWISYAGGRVRHPEFRQTEPPAQETQQEHSH
jgi:hypothetical protein